MTTSAHFSSVKAVSAFAHLAYQSSDRLLHIEPVNFVNASAKCAPQPCAVTAHCPL